MPSASKVKGSGFEREVAKYLSDIYGESFIRAPGSGAYTGGSNSARRQILHENQVRSFKGDIVPGQSFPLFNAEAKFYGDFSFNQLFTGSNQLESWIKQLMAAADEGDLNILFMKFNRKGRYVAVQAKHRWNLGCNYMLYISPQWGGWYIVHLEGFFDLNVDQVKQYSSKQVLVESK